jgi:GAF domain-containing protein
MTDRVNGDEIRQATTSSGHPADAGLARELSEVARQLQAVPDTNAMLQRMVEAAVHNVPGTRWAGITLLDNGRMSTPAQSGDMPSAIDELQHRLRQGPCVQSSKDQITVVSNDLRVETRWPEFAGRAVELGVLAMLSVQLFVESRSFGALNLYSDKPNVFDAEAENVGLLFAAHAGIALADSRIAANLRTALDSRDIIGQAKGIVMERYKITAQQAFDMLVYVSQHHQRKLRDIALDLAQTGEFA